MYWARYVLVDQALRGRGMCSTECNSSYLYFLFLMLCPPNFGQGYIHPSQSSYGGEKLDLHFHITLDFVGMHLSIKRGPPVLEKQGTKELRRAVIP